jgi:hypothetical protein
MDPRQVDDPAKLAAALVTLVAQDEPPLCVPTGANAVNTFEQKSNSLLAQANAHRELSSCLAHDDA